MNGLLRSAVDQFLKLLSRFEVSHAFCRDLDRGPGFRVSAATGIAFADAEAAKAAQLDPSFATRDRHMAASPQRTGSAPAASRQAHRDPAPVASQPLVQENPFVLPSAKKAAKAPKADDVVQRPRAATRSGNSRRPQLEEIGEVIVKKTDEDKDPLAEWQAARVAEGAKPKTAAQSDETDNERKWSPAGSGVQAMYAAIDSSRPSNPSASSSQSLCRRRSRTSVAVDVGAAA